jgi:hypothetical protein
MYSDQKVSVSVVAPWEGSCYINDQKTKNSVVLARKQNIPTERPQPAGEVIANFS